MLLLLPGQQPAEPARVGPAREEPGPHHPHRADDGGQLGRRVEGATPRLGLGHLGGGRQERRQLRRRHRRRRRRRRRHRD